MDNQPGNCTDPASKPIKTFSIHNGPLPSIDEVSDSLVKTQSGAVSVFLGVTRDNFNGRSVTQLSYECYDKMALKCMESICD